MLRTLFAFGATIAVLSGPAMISASLEDKPAPSGEVSDFSGAAVIIKSAVSTWSEAPRACGKLASGTARVTVMHCEPNGAS